MGTLADKACLACIGCALVPLAGPPTMAAVALFLVSVCASAACELAGARRWRAVLSLASAAAMLPPGATACALPLVLYDLAWLGVGRLAPAALALAVASARGTGLAALVPIAAVAVLSMMLQERAARTERLGRELHGLRDSLQERLIDLERSRRELVEARDVETHAATLAERARISREIHDNVGHLLTRSLLQLEALEVVHADEPALRSDFHEVASTVRQALDVTRTSVHAMADDAFDLETELRRLAQRSGIADVELSCGLEDVPAPVARCFVALCREALTNAARHARARHARIRVTEFPGLWQLVVTNDGDLPRGGSELQLAAGGMGIHSMRERVEALGGTFRLSCDQEFSVFASVPRGEHARSGDR